LGRAKRTRRFLADLSRAQLQAENSGSGPTRWICSGRVGPLVFSGSGSEIIGTISTTQQAKKFWPQPPIALVGSGAIKLLLGGSSQVVHDQV